MCTPNFRPACAAARSCAQQLAEVADLPRSLGRNSRDFSCGRVLTRTNRQTEIKLTNLPATAEDSTTTRTNSALARCLQTDLTESGTMADTVAKEHCSATARSLPQSTRLSPAKLVTVFLPRLAERDERARVVCDASTWPAIARRRATRQSGRPWPPPPPPPSQRRASARTSTLAARRRTCYECSASLLAATPAHGRARRRAAPCPRSAALTSPSSASVAPPSPTSGLRRQRTRQVAPRSRKQGRCARPARPKRLIGRGWPNRGAALGMLWR